MPRNPFSFKASYTILSRYLLKLHCRDCEMVRWFGALCTCLDFLWFSLATRQLNYQLVGAPLLNLGAPEARLSRSARFIFIELKVDFSRVDFLLFCAEKWPMSQHIASVKLDKHSIEIRVFQTCTDKFENAQSYNVIALQHVPLFLYWTALPYFCHF